MHFTDVVVFPRLVWTARTAGKGISIGTDAMSRVSFHAQNLHAVIKLILCCCFYSLNPSMYYSIAIIVMEKAHIDIHPKKKKSGFKRLFIRQYGYFRM